MPLWKTAISFDGVLNSPAPAGPYPNANHPALTSAVCLSVHDGMGNFWVASCGLTLVPDGMGNLIGGQFCQLSSRQTKPPFFVDADIDPWTWFAGGASTSSAGVAAYLAGGTLSILKNFGANLITVSSPCGAVSVALDADDFFRTNSGLNDTPLYPGGFGFSYIFDNVTNPPVTSTVQASFFNFLAQKDGITVFAIPLSAADPGTWFVFNDYLFDNTLGGEEYVNGIGLTGIGNPIAAAQTTLRYVLTASLSSGPPFGSTPAQTTEDFWKTYGLNPPLSNDTDMDAAPEHGIVWRAGPDVRDGSTMLVQRTFNNAGSWETWTAFQDDTTSNSSPTVTWYNQALYLTWFDGTNIQEVRSMDGGQNWNMPTTIPFTGTNPRRVIDRTGGPSLYFFFDASNHLQVVATYDSGASYEGPFTVASSVSPQQIDAEFMPDGSIVVSINVLGALTQFRSRDLAHTWS